MRTLKERLEDIANAMPPVDRKRAIEIANQSEFGLLEFYELTGVDAGTYGLYDIDDEGVHLRLRKEKLSVSERLAVKDALTKLEDLKFPCTPQSFCNWYQTTCGTNSVSDFPLADGFFKAVTKKEPITLRNNEQPVTKKQIIEAFNVRSDAIENTQWWSGRMGNAKKTKLGHARFRKGIPGIKGHPSLWHPVAVAWWLIDSKHMDKKRVIHLTKTHFPDCDVDHLE